MTAFAWRIFLQSVLLLSLICPSSFAATPEYQLKAAFLFNFTQFVQWPPQAFTRSDSPLSVCILGEDPFGTYLDDLVRGEFVNGHPLTVERHRNDQELQHCHILFFANSESENYHDILFKLKDHNVLTISNIENFARVGGIICFQVVNNRLRFRINIRAAHDAQLAISSKLLKQADVIGDTED